ncbi:MAG TPA: hypothetical protein HPP87_13495 [Planctomycetes bacterium]|nr:hypothetical protein [Planctomycetota bacterium]
MIVLLCPAVVAGGSSDTLPAVGFTRTDSSGFEGTLEARLWLKLSRACDKTVTVECAIAGGTTQQGKDFSLADSIVAFAPGTTQANVSIAVSADDVKEKPETVVLRLKDPINATLAETSSHTFTISEPEGMHLKIDFGLPEWTGTEMQTDKPLANTVKQGWTPWVSPRWADMYDHGGVQLEAVAGTGINMQMSTVRGGHMTLKVAGMISGLAGGFKPFGEPIYEPLCNSWIYNCDWPDTPWGDIIVAVYNLPTGKYKLRSYHNHFYCKRIKGTDDPTLIDCSEIGKPQPVMPSIRALSQREVLDRYEGVESWHNVKSEIVNAHPEYFDNHGQSDYPDTYALGPIGSGDVKTIEPALNVEPQQVITDAELKPSEMIFTTDGSAVYIVYEAGCCVADGVRKSRKEGGRAILNAFELIYLDPQ